MPRLKDERTEIVDAVATTTVIVTGHTGLGLPLLAVVQRDYKDKFHTLYLLPDTIRAIIEWYENSQPTTY